MNERREVRPEARHKTIVPGIYAITDAASKQRFDFESGVEAALRGGARLIQYRDKSSAAKVRAQEAHALRRLCQEYDALLIINDDVDLAQECGADGVHLGRDDADIDTARKRLGENAIIGWSCYDDLARAHRAAEAGADYIAFGSVFPSSTKPDAVRAPLELFRQAADLGPALCAIGGITHENAPAVVQAGAQLLAVVNGVFDAATPAGVEANARACRAAFDTGSSSS